MKYILYDNIKGDILGLNIEETEGYVTLSDDAYDFILSHNGNCYVNVDKVNARLKGCNESNNPEFLVVNMTCISIERKYDTEIIQENIINKNTEYCNMYIVNGIHFTLDNRERKKYKYELEDQANMEQLMRLVDNGSFNDDTGIPIKASGESTYDLLTVSEFRRLYAALIRHKYYHLFYLRQYNEYIKSLNSPIELNRCQYGMILPDEYTSKVDNQLENFKKII